MPEWKPHSLHLLAIIHRFVYHEDPAEVYYNVHVLWLLWATGV